MKNYLCLLLLLISFTACKKGDTGAPGNANVKQYTFGPHDFTTTAGKNLLINISKDSVDAYAWFIYMIVNTGTARYNFSLPGYGNNNTYYRVFARPTSDSIYTIGIIRLTGVGEPCESFKVIRILISDKVNMDGRRSSPLPDINFSDYAVVKKYYNLPD